MVKKIGLLSLLLVIFVITFTIYWQRNDSLYSLFHKDKPFIKITSHKQGFPVIDDNGRLSIYSFNDKAKKPTNIKVGDTGFLSGAGSSSPVASPDFLYSAFIDQEKRNLWVISNETFEKVQITRSGEIAEYITGWSPNGRRIIYVTGHNEVARIGGGNGEKVVKSKPILRNSGEFYLFDLETGQSTKLPIKHFQGFLDNNRILIKDSDNYGNEGNRIFAFDLKTFKTDDSFMPGIYGPEIGQFNIANDRKKWIFLFSNNPTVTGNDSSVVVADFPKKTGITLDSGGWADFQSPKISPNSTKVAYTKKEVKSLDNPKYGVIIYDLLTNTPQRLSDGYPVRWLNDNSLIVYSTDEKALYLVDIKEKVKSRLN